MNHINRAVVKQQAKDIIRGKVFYLFLITLVVSLLCGVSYNFNVNFRNLDFGPFGDRDSSHSYENDSDYFNDFDYENPIENFEFNSYSSNENATSLSVFDIPSGFDYDLKPNVWSIKAIIFAPLAISMAGIYLALVRRNPMEEFKFGTEFAALFKTSFNNTYWRKLATVLLRGILMVLLMLCFFVPGIIFAYSSYFTNEIMSDNPNLKPMEAINLSKKMVQGNRTELFIFDLSFIPWYLLCCVTVGLGCIYVLPYVYTAKALYYENFRMRALQEGRITADDFLSFEERYSQYNVNNGYNTGNANYTANRYSYTNPNKNVNSSENTGYYYSQQNVNAQTQAENNTQQSDYNTTPDHNQNAEPDQTEQNNYNTPPEEN